jgi:hypothetical protein
MPGWSLIPASIWLRRSRARAPISLKHLWITAARATSAARRWPNRAWHPRRRVRNLLMLAIAPLWSTWARRSEPCRA